MRYLLKRVWSLNKRLILIDILNSAFSACVPLVDVVGISIVIAALTEGLGQGVVLARILLFVGLNLLFKLMAELLSWRHNVQARRASNTIAYQFTMDNIHVDYQHVQDGSLEALRQRSMRLDPGSFMSLLGSFAGYAVQIIGVVAIFARLAPLFIGAMLIISLLLILLAWFEKKNDYHLTEAKEEGDRRLEYLYMAMTDYKYAKDIRVNQAGGLLEKQYTSAMKAQLAKIKGFFSKSMLCNALGTVVTLIQTACMYLYFAYLAYTGSLSIAEFTLTLGSTTLFLTTALSCFQSIALVRQSIQNAAYLKEYMEQIDKKQRQNKSNDLPDAQIDFASATLYFDHVFFAYPSAAEDTLCDINLSIRPGERIGIVGLNGAGKTTLIKLLLRLYEPTGGKITLGGIDIQSIPYRQYIRQIGVVLQDYYLFAYSVKENISFDQPEDTVRLEKSIAESGLTEKMTSLPNGMDTSVYRTLDDQGVEFSGGEGQRLALARALYKDASLLILDEPSSALDPAAEADLFARMDKLIGDRASIFISHRLSSTASCDRILVLDQGRVAESGSHKELLAMNGIYTKLFLSQAKHYREEAPQ